MRQLIRNTFFNPILHFLPLLTFLVADEFYGMNIAWKIAFPVVFILVFYLYYLYNHAFTWNLFFSFMFMTIGLIASVASLLLDMSNYQNLTDKIVVSLMLLLFLLFRKKVQKIISSQMPAFIPMSNNFNEMYRVIWFVFITLAVYIFLYISSNLVLNSISTVFTNELSNVFVALIVSFSLYEVLRIKLIRHELEGEEWWPIVNTKGEIIGNIEHFTSLTDKKKFIHPTIRVMILDKGRLLLQKNTANNIVAPELWDTTLHNHIRTKESLEQCIERTVSKMIPMKDFKYMHLSNYSCENKFEIQHAILLVSCQLLQLEPQLNGVQSYKWWTKAQIEENITSGIFSENFIAEYDLIKRSGLLETGKCNCNCGLKQAIKMHSSIYKNNNN